MTNGAALPSVSVVIPTYNRRQRLPAVLEPLLAASEADEIVVVVDGSTDGSAELLERISRDEPRLRALQVENRGANGARLAGAETAHGEVVLTLDDDVIPEPGLVAGHLHRHAGHARLVVLGYMPLAPRSSGRREFPAALYEREYERVVMEWEKDPDSILTSMWAGNLSIRRSDYLMLAPMVERVVSGYHEDLDFGLCCREAGLVGLFDRSLRATHLYHRDPAGFLRDARSSGITLPIVYGRHEEQVGALPKDFAYGDLPRPLRGLARVGTRHASLRLLTRCGVNVAGKLRLFTLQRRGAGLLWRMEQGHAASGPAEIQSVPCRRGEAR